MALKNMIKLRDKVTFGRAGEAKCKGTVVKLNPKTAHIKCSNGDVMSVSYGLIQKPRKGPGSRTASKPVRKARARKTKRNPTSYEDWSRIQKGPPKGWSPKKATNSELHDYRDAKGTSASTRKAILKEQQRRISIASGLKFDPMTGEPLENPSYHHAKRNPHGSFSQTRAPKVSKYALWLSKQAKGDLKKLDESLSVLLRGSGRGLSGLKEKQVEVRRELRTRR